jgi:hypothetical protein
MDVSEQASNCLKRYGMLMLISVCFPMQNYNRANGAQWGKRKKK